MTRISIIIAVLAMVGAGFWFVSGDERGGERRAAWALPGLSREEAPEPKVEAITSAHGIATDAGFEILEQGGTAADAAVAVAATLSVVEPWFSSVLGGGTWALYYNAETEAITSLDGVGPTGSLATAQNYAPRAGTQGMHQANVPGAWDGWMVWLDEYGTLELPEVLAPAIRVAREGYEVSELMATWLRNQSSITIDRPDSARIYAPNGTILTAGETVYQHDMADTFERLIAAYNEARPNGRAAAITAARDYFYRGPLAEEIVAFSEAQNGYLTLPDFAAMNAELREPIYIDYNDEVRVFQNPPNSQGITMLLALNALKGFDFGEYASPDDPAAIHLQAEAVKLAFADRHYHVGDPARIDVPTAGLLREEHAARQRARIDMEQAMRWPIQDGYEPLPDDLANTTSFHVVDSMGNGAAVTTSLGAQFLVVGDTGIHINHRMRFMATEDGPNQVTPGFKVRHTSNPYIALRNGELFMLGGNTGADTQSQAQAQQFISVVEFGLSAQEAVARPRFLSTAFPSSVYSYQVRNTLQMEDGFPQATYDELRRRGHTLAIGDGTWGNGHMIILRDGGYDADVGTEPRVEVAAGEKKMYNENGEREEVE